MDRALNRLHGLVQIWSFECLQVMEGTMPKNIDNSDDEVEENESELSLSLSFSVATK